MVGSSLERRDDNSPQWLLFIKHGSFMPQQTIARTKISTRRNQFGEYVVKAYDSNGSRMPDHDYYTNDKSDAIATAAMMTAGRVEAVN
jgi:hypothetical protein